MRVPSILSIFIVAFLSCVTLASAQTGTGNTFFVNLSLGSSGSEVVLLQQALNRDPETQVATFGPGAPGNETSYFGALTQAAVVRFQQKYATEVLAPAGLSQGSGYVGFYTRVKLNSLLATPISVSAVSPPSPPSQYSAVAPTQATPAAPIAVGSGNRNLDHIDTIFADIDKVGNAQGLSAAALASVKSAVKERLSTTTDLTGNFLKLVQDNRSALNTSSGNGVFSSFKRMVFEIFSPTPAYAAAATPFGGALLSAVPCNGGVWNVYLSPLPPAFVVTLSYLSGSQAFLSYNIPVTNWLLGEFTPGPGSCVVGTVPVPSEGIITPMVGSSPL